MHFFPSSAIAWTKLTLTTLRSTAAPNTWRGANLGTASAVPISLAQTALNNATALPTCTPTTLSSASSVSTEPSALCASGAVLQTTSVSSWPSPKSVRSVRRRYLQDQAPPRRISLRAALGGSFDFAAQRSLVGMLEHFRCVNCRPPLHLLVRASPALCLCQRPGRHSCPRRRRCRTHAPTARARGSSRRRPIHGAYPRHACRSSPAHPRIVTAYADAATDSTPPGLGSYCQGLFWYVERLSAHTNGCTLRRLSCWQRASTPSPSNTCFRPRNALSSSVTPSHSPLAFALTRKCARSPMLCYIHPSHPARRPLLSERCLLCRGCSHQRRRERG
eukprot:1565221-Pleurochrysis_carterae.AAC.2